MMKHNVLNILALCCTVWSVNALSNTPKPSTYPIYQPVGEATMTWLWFDIYDAKLSTPSGRYTANEPPLTLELIYARPISSKQLVDATEKEWQRMNISYASEWLIQLRSMWPNITPSDRLLLHVNSDGHSEFFYNNQPIGVIEDAAFSSAFTAIWLSERALKPELRDQLIGAQS